MPSLLDLLFFVLPFFLVGLLADLPAHEVADAHDLVQPAPDDAPVDLVEDLADIVLLSDKQRPAAVGRGLPQLECQAFGLVKVSDQPNPAVAVVCPCVVLALFHLLAKLLQSRRVVAAARMVTIAEIPCDQVALDAERGAARTSNSLLVEVVDVNLRVCLRPPHPGSFHGDQALVPRRPSNWPPPRRRRRRRGAASGAGLGHREVLAGDPHADPAFQRSRA
mmetsp:Transcript_23307/g.58876  ORF Transcript_23307/g.58876 Transcript_23307/m.58876 type:complete len:221 (-) Transcript_23307:161-823(-)